MSQFTRVALAGATGNLGPAILDALLAADFQVIVLTRINSTKHSFPSSATVLPVDYDSLASLTKALSGQEVLISTLGPAAFSAQLLLVEAASKAQVKRFIPSEFGSNTLNERTRVLPVFKPKVAVQDALRKHADVPGGLTYTLIYTGPFFDWGLKIGLLMNLKDRSAPLYDGGERLFSTTRLATIGKAVVGVLQHPEQTRNRAVYVQDTAITQTKLLSMVKNSARESEQGKSEWESSVEPLDRMLEEAHDLMKKGGQDALKWHLNFIKVSIFGEGYGCHFDKLDNELLGIEEMKDTEIQAMVDDCLTSAK